MFLQTRFLPFIVIIMIDLFFYKYKVQKLLISYTIIELINQSQD